MKWMGGWGPDDLAAADPEMVDEIIRMIQEEAEEHERMREEMENR